MGRSWVVVVLCSALACREQPTPTERALDLAMLDLEERVRELGPGAIPEVTGPFFHVDLMLREETRPVRGRAPADARAAFHARVALLLTPYVERFGCEPAPPDAELLELLGRANAELHRRRVARLEACAAAASAARASEVTALREQLDGKLLLLTVNHASVPLGFELVCAQTVLEKHLQVVRADVGLAKTGELGVRDAAAAVAQVHVFSAPSASRSGAS